MEGWILFLAGAGLFLVGLAVLRYFRRHPVPRTFDTLEDIEAPAVPAAPPIVPGSRTPGPEKTEVLPPEP